MYINIHVAREKTLWRRIYDVGLIVIIALGSLLFLRFILKGPKNNGTDDEETTFDDAEYFEKYGDFYSEFGTEELDEFEVYEDMY